MRFRILGPVSMTPRTPTAAKVRVLLAALLVRANEVVSTESLIDELWDIDPPRTAATTLQVYVSQLRKALADADGPDDAFAAGRRLHTVPPGYRLHVGEDELDLSRFEFLRRSGKEAYERGNFAAASGLLRESLDLWTGVALSGVPHGPVLATTGVRLEELRTVTLEQRIAADLRLGRHHELTGELMELVSRHPYRETLHAHLMVALFRADRQSDALRAFGRARRSLVEELGVEPGAGLRKLHDRILRSDPTLAWQEPVAQAGQEPAPALWLPPATADFTGREDVLTVAGKLLPEAAGPAPQPVLVVSGRAGVGKSALAVELARRNADRFPAGQVLLHLRGPRDMALDAGQAMAGLLRRIGPGSEGAPADQPPPAGGEEAVAAPAGDREELAERLHRAVQGRRLLVILDDASSEEQVRPLLAALPDTFTVVTSRRTLAGLDGARHLTLDVLRPNEAQKLLASIVGPRLADDPAAAQEIARLCGHLPLAVRVAGTGLAARPHWTAAAWAARLADESAGLSRFVAGDLDVRASLLAGYREVGPAEQRAFRLLSLAPVPDFPLWSAAALLGLPPAEAEQLVERLVESQLLGVRRAASGQAYRYSYHRLLRKLALELLADELPGEVESATERLGTAYLGYARYADALLAPGRLARSGEPGSAGSRSLGSRSLGSRSVGTSSVGTSSADSRSAEPRPAAARAAAAGAAGGSDPAAVVGDTPARWFQDEAAGLVDAVRQAHTAGLWRLTWELAGVLTGWFEAGSVWGDWAATHELALDATRLAERPAERAAVLHSLGDLAWQQRRTRPAADRYESARALFAAAGDRAGEARCLVGLADVALSSGEAGHAGKLYAQAAELFAADGPGHARGQADVLRGLALVSLLGGRTEEALHRFGDFVEAAQRLGDKRWSQFGSRSIDRIQEHVVDWATGRRLEALEVRPGVWLVGVPYAGVTPAGGVHTGGVYTG
ncbi:NB-ARC domain-containing protein [Kitasatospora sp. NBC_00240]|uniref:BTAD domain-containing putative transcriptional regulator n=1 Tax=Kitasatospora sp. NBC_00240 TaxID=2903567 RepID=UPI002255D064|nr:AfsR/SARP family transcriptional regulator [Kitasatospora sp. NBC_00240]MCX5211505.1 NB-ARC domain-containing protein [Kitasatospora sp. NBC_00240]